MLLVIGVIFACSMFLLACLLLFKSRLTHAGGIVYKKENGRTLYLIVSSSSIKNKWVLPKGHIEKNEKPVAAAIREVMEESGVLARPVKKAGITRYQKKGQRLACVYFVMEFLQVKGHGIENRKVVWLEKTEALERLGNDKVKSMLQSIAL